MVLKIERFQPEGSESATNPSQETASSSGSGCTLARRTKSGRKLASGRCDDERGRGVTGDRARHLATARKPRKLATVGTRVARNSQHDLLTAMDSGNQNSGLAVASAMRLGISALNLILVAGWRTRSGKLGRAAGEKRRRFFSPARLVASRGTRGKISAPDARRRGYTLVRLGLTAWGRS